MMLRKKNRKFILLAVFIAAGLFTISLFSQNVSHRADLLKGNIDIPTERKIKWNQHSVFADTIYQTWANRALNPDDGKVNAPRIMLGKLLLKKDIAEVNALILKTLPWGVTGSVWALNKKGDYDFTMAILCTILYLFGNQPHI